VQIQVDNDSRDPIDVYLVAETREWFVGRVAPGVKTWLPVPERALSSSPGMVRLVALPNAPRSMSARRDPRAIVSLSQPATALIDQRWAFTQGQFVARQADPFARRP
jgi:hypothetical protein